jgi:ribosomal protein L35AE/L33A
LASTTGGKIEPQQGLVESATGNHTGVVNVFRTNLPTQFFGVGIKRIAGALCDVACRRSI